MEGSMLKPTNIIPFSCDEGLLPTVGNRVRTIRKMRGLSRRLLSEKSDVSQRYIAQLETGGGNISIVLLARVADALDFKIEYLVGEHDPWESDLPKFCELYQGASQDQQSRIRQILNSNTSQANRQNRIALIGLRGAGKSTLGQLVANDLGLPFVELNREIEAQSGIANSEVIALYGPEGYRQLEHRALARAAEEHDKMIMAVAGGVVSAPETYAYLLDNFHTIWVKASPQEHMERVRAQGDERPMAGNPRAMEELRGILTQREMDYAKASATLDTADTSVATSKRQLLEIIQSKTFLG